MKNSNSSKTDRTEIKSIDIKLMMSYVVLACLFLVAVHGLTAHPDIKPAYEVFASVSP